MNAEPELRRDPITGRWVLIAPERAHRPIALSGPVPAGAIKVEIAALPSFLNAQPGEALRSVPLHDAEVTIGNGEFTARVDPASIPASMLAICPIADPPVPLRRPAILKIRYASASASRVIASISDASAFSAGVGAARADA